jgi:2-desacetyl-2-hydroxyethyl bacteriochlorophyllide A dehydrogenase
MVKHMQALAWQGPEDVRLSQVEEPGVVKPEDVLVQVEVAGVCGSDLHVYHGRETGLDSGTVMGHEFVGRVLEVGSAVRSLRPGDRVFAPFTTSCGGCWYCRQGLTCRCRHGQLFGWVAGGEGLQGVQAERVRVPLADTTLLPLPEELHAEEGLLLGDVLSTGVYCADRAEVDGEGVYVVLGCGPVGLMAVVGALERGARHLLAVDRVAARLALAERFGARPVHLDQEDIHGVVKELTDGRGADGILEAVGSAGAGRLALELVRPGGTISTAGVHTEPGMPFSPAEAYDRNLTYRVGRCPARHYMERLLPLVRSRRYPLRDVISHRLPLTDGVEAYRMFAARTDGCTKVVLHP